MKNKIISIALIILFSSIYLYLSHPTPKYEGHQSIAGLNNPVDIYTDKFGVPHLFAQNEEDLFYAAGYYAARDRLFQMSIVNFSVRGELSYAFGDELLESDIYLRTWRIHDTAKKLVKELNPETFSLITAFCAGINYRIDEVYNDLPIEFKLLQIKPPVWNPSIVTGYGRMMAREMSSSWKPEIVFGAIENYFGKEKLKEVYPYYDDDFPTITKKTQTVKNVFFSEIMDQELLLESLLGYNSSASGSNNWVVSGSRTKSGKPLLANDPHLKFTQPPRWYEMHLKGGRFNVSGLCLAGIPMPIIGQNEHMAWGLTNSMVDDMDFFIESINPKNPNQYLYNDSYQDMRVIKEKIPLKNGRDTTITIRLTHHGPIITDVHSLIKEDTVALSMAWTGNWLTKEIDGLFGLATSKNWDDFSKAVKNYGVPGQNIVYADVFGNIGWRPAVYIPIRKEGSSLIPRPGHDPDYDWNGRVPYKEMPYLFNPESGYIATANNKTIDENFPYYISGLWADPSRAQQIISRLDTLNMATIGDMKSVQLDYTSLFAKEITPYFLSVNILNENEKTKKSMTILEEWDFIEDPDSRGALIFHSILRQLVIEVFGDELSLLGDKYLEAFTSMKYLHSRSLRKILANGSSSWVDDIRTKEKIETIEEVLKKSFIKGIEDIENIVGHNMKNWEWGRAHYLKHEHKMGSNKILDWIFNFNVGPYLSGGSDKSPNAGSYSFSKPYAQTSGASMRRVVDFSNLNETQQIIPTGQSGLHNSRHYDDQADLYHSGKYRTTWFDETYIRNNKEFKRLTLLPLK
jgi:penicillin amidase